MSGSENPTEPVRRETFGWTETAHRVRELHAAAQLMAVEQTRFLHGTLADGTRVRVVPPLVQPIPDAGVRSALAWADALPDRLGCECVVLLRAGAAALGLWRDDRLLLHKAFKRYVVRGRGRAQPSYLRHKGKSAYGSRLRLQNARSLLRDVNERLRDWSEHEGGFDRVYYACPVRLWADLSHATPAPPFDPAAAIRIPHHVRTPTFEELGRVRRLLVRGCIEWFDAATPDAGDTRDTRDAGDAGS